MEGGLLVKNSSFPLKRHKSYNRQQRKSFQPRKREELCKRRNPSSSLTANANKNPSWDASLTRKRMKMCSSKIAMKLFFGWYQILVSWDQKGTWKNHCQAFGHREWDSWYLPIWPQIEIVLTVWTYNCFVCFLIFCSFCLSCYEKILIEFSCKTFSVPWVYCVSVSRSFIYRWW